MGSRRIANDVQKIAPFVDEGWVIVSSEGKITSKHDFLQVIKSGDLVHTRMEFTDGMCMLKFMEVRESL